MLFYLMLIIITVVTVVAFVWPGFTRDNTQVQEILDSSIQSIQRQMMLLNNQIDNEEFIQLPELELVEIPLNQIQNSKLSNWIEEQDQNCSNSNQENSNESCQNSDVVFAALHASLQKLMIAADSGQINGVQLYEILLRETLLHERAIAEIQKTQRSVSETPLKNLIVLNESSDSSFKIDANLQNEPLKEEPKMYFGQSPLEYVPHNKTP